MQTRNWFSIPQFLGTAGNNIDQWMVNLFAKITRFEIYTFIMICDGFSKFKCVTLSTDQCGKNAVLNIKFGWDIPELLQKTKMGQNQVHWL